ncbi:hypothetical protein MKI79_01510 [Acinetobacter sp. A3.8]|uniref:Lipocalin-like domain-containing protein n=1 Tax=Acinetobacter sedimenti TaxID=2919922 RepID=A0A9X2B808_9GAMM|nr:hypothetical protein [Acinetobacter sedimenti]MCJ8145599.1 hypothetical protein [Acinetobacter sedimenti]
MKLQQNTLLSLALSFIVTFATNQAFAGAADGYWAFDKVEDGIANVTELRNGKITMYAFDCEDDSNEAIDQEEYDYTVNGKNVEIREDGEVTQTLTINTLSATDLILEQSLPEGKSAQLKYKRVEKLAPVCS